jgi:small-conductance mechanosensitive channel
LFKRTLPGAAVLTIVITSWLGYAELSRLLFWGIVGTSIGLLLVLIGTRLFDDLQDSLDEGRYGWQRTLRTAAGLGSNDPVPALGWLTLLLKGGLWLLFIFFVLQLWGVPPNQILGLGNLLYEGFTVGSLKIVPSRIVGALLLLLLLIMASRWMARRLEHSWLTRTRIERGAREAVATTVGYAGIAASILLTLTMAGIDFSNLAIIAGALSVGIGFGLQNVVNNFVSGLIMLFERPVKTGDWIVVGATEGYVRRISIRTTTIQTFDRADVIVPNSELISNQVTNWMHSSSYGRFKIPVGVAYGSDTEKVRDLMLQVAQEHPQVVRGFPSWPDPTVLFIGFGDSSLNFELRGIIYNIDMRMRVMSDLNFAIDKTFREHGIEIPFPQRVIHHAAPGNSSDKPTEDPKAGDVPD